MCFHSKLSADAQSIENRFKAKFTKPNYKPMDRYVGFAHPRTPIISRQYPQLIHHAVWGLVPSWAKDLSIQAHTLNARIETLHEKPSFKASVQQRCLVLVDGFYEWQWLDPKGQKKQQYLIGLEQDAPFALAGIYNSCVHPQTGEFLHTYAIVTTAAIGLMAQIHNSKNRMPVVLSPETEQAWLAGAHVLDFTKPNIDLVARAI
jgi:putative SOS response-associated peptidase YedK